MKVFFVFVDLFNMTSSAVSCWTTRCGGVRASHEGSASNYRIRSTCVYFEFLQGWQRGCKSFAVTLSFLNLSVYQIPYIQLASHNHPISQMLNTQPFQVVCSCDLDYVSRAVVVFKREDVEFLVRIFPLQSLVVKRVRSYFKFGNLLSYLITFERFGAKEGA
jgi:hypothetical protein